MNTHNRAAGDASPPCVSSARPLNVSGSVPFACRVCGAPVKVYGSTTKYYACSACGLPQDPQPVKGPVYLHDRPYNSAVLILWILAAMILLAVVAIAAGLIWLRTR